MRVILVYSWLSVVGLFIVFKGIPPLILLLKVFCAMTGTGIGMYFWNDICDYKQDISSSAKEFAPSSRPIGMGLVSKRRMEIFSVLMVALGLTSAALINIEVLLIQSAFLFIFFIYSAEPIRLKRIFLMKQVIVTIGGAMAGLTAGLAAGSITVQLIYLIGLYMLFTMGVNPILDIKDIESDIVGGVKTIPIVLGPGFTLRLALATFTASALSTWVGFYGFGFNIALPILGTIVLAAFMYVMYPLLGHLEDHEYMTKIIITRGYPLYFVLQIAVLVGSLSF